jgi:hypothetical protein
MVTMKKNPSHAETPLYKGDSEDYGRDEGFLSEKLRTQVSQASLE